MWVLWVLMVWDLLTFKSQARLHKDTAARYLCALKGGRPASPLYPPQWLNSALVAEGDNDKICPHRKALMSKKLPLQKRDKIVHIRLTSEEFFLLNQKKNRAELARWMRETLLSDESTKQITTVKHQLPPEVVRFLGGIGNNLNQIARNVNAAAKSGEMGQLDAIKILTEINATDRALTGLRDFLRKQNQP